MTKTIYVPVDDSDPSQYPTDPPMTYTAEQPPPSQSADSTPVLNYVLADLIVKARESERKYGTKLTTQNGRDALVDLYQELLDACMYCRQLLLERDGK